MRRTIRFLAVLAAPFLLAMAPAVAHAAVVAPTVTSSTSTSEVMLGEQTTVVVDFDNNDGGGNAGFGPFADILIRSADSSGDAGQGLSLIGAPTLGAGGPTLAYQTIDCATVPFDHPAAVDAAGLPVQVTVADCPAGSSFVHVTLPFGSFTDSQPSAKINLKLQVSDLASYTGAAGDDLEVRARGGYRFGADALDNPATDPSVLGAFPAAGAGTLISPELFEITKTYIGPENETATGPSFPRRFRIDASIASGQQIDLLTLTDALPDGIVVTGITAAAADSVLYNGLPAAAQLDIRADGVTTLQAAWTTGATVGAGSGSPVRTVLVDFYVANVLSDDSELLPAGADRTINNVGSLSGSWTPALAANDGGNVAVSGDSAVAPGLSIEAAAIVVQKSRVAPASPKVGNTVQYRIDGQVSDYYAVEDVVVDDSLKDGLKIDTGVKPMLTVSRGGVDVVGPIDMSANYTYTSRTADAGTRDLQRFDVGAFLAAQPFEAGRLRGGCVPATPALYDPAATFEPTCAAGALTFSITYSATVLATYEEDPSPGKRVVARDSFDNTVGVTADVLDTNTAGWPVAGAPSVNGSSNAFQLADGAITKRIYAINGAICAPGSCAAAAANVKPGDTVTYYLSYEVPAPGVDDLVLSDFLPLPVLKVTAGTPTWNPALVADDSLASDEVRPYNGPELPIHTYSDAGVAISSNIAGNSFTLDWGSTPTTLAANERVALLAKFTVNTDPFADALRLNNQLNVTTANTAGTDDRFDSYGEFTLRQPKIEIRKGVGPTDNPTDDSFAGTVAGVNAPPAAPVLAGTPVSTATALTWNANVTNLDAHDRVRYVVSVANTGGAPAKNVTVCDTLPAAGMVGGATPTVSNFTVFNQTGADVTADLTGLPTGKDAFFDCATEADFATPIPAGEVRFIVYDLQVDTGASVLYTPMKNTAELSKFENVGSTENFVTTPRTDDATATATRDAAISKTFVDTTTGLPIASPQTLTIGQKARYRVRVTLDEGTFANLKVVDTLDAGLAFTSDPVSIVPSANITSCSALACNATNFPGVKSATDSVFTWDFGTVINGQTDNGATRETIDIFYWVIVRDVASNTATPATALDNNAVVTHDACGGGAPEPACPGAQSVTANVAEPKITPDKTVTPTTLDTSDVATWTISLPVTGGVTAHTVDFLDDIPAGLTYVAGSLEVDGDTCAVFLIANPTSTCTDVDLNANTRADMHVTWTSLASGATPVITFQTTLDAAAATAGATITNTGYVTWKSLADIANQCATQTDCDERDYTANDPASVTVAVPVTTKAMIASSDANTRMTPAPAHLAVGETAQYEVEIDIPEGTTPSMRLVDTVAAGLRFVQVDEIVLGTGTLATDLNVDGATGATLAAKLASIVTATNTAVADPTAAPGTRTADGRQIGLHFGDVKNTQTTGGTTTRSLLVRYTVAATNVAGNQAGTALPNSAVVSYNGTNTAPAVVTSEIVEPNLVVAKTMTVDTTTIPGERLYKIELTASHSGSTAVAYDTIVSDDLAGSGLTLFDSPAAADDPICAATGAATCTGPAIAGTKVSTTSPLLAFTPTAETLKLTFWARVASTHEVGTNVSNTGRVEWSSLAADDDPRVSACPGTVAVPSATCIERNGADGPGVGLDNYAHTDTKTASQVPTIAKVRTAPAPPADKVVVGETVKWKVTVTVPAGTTKTVSLVDTADQGLAFPDPSANITVTPPAGVTVATSTGTVANLGAGADPEARELTITLGDIVNTNTTDQDVVITYDTVVRNSMYVQDSSPALNNSVVMTYSQGTLGAVSGETVDVTEPNVVIDKTIIPSSIDAGTSATIRLDLNSNGNATARGIVVTDILPARMRRQGVAWVTGFTMTCTIEHLAPSPVGEAPLGGDCTTVTGGGPVRDTVSIVVPDLAPGASVRLQFNVMLDTALPPGENVSNTGSVTWRSMPIGQADADVCGDATAICTGRTGADGEPGAGILNDYADSDADVAAGATVSSISGNVWHDVDNDGIKDGGEPCIDGVTVTLTGTDLLGNAINAVAVTGGAVIDGRTGAAFVPAATSACGAYRFDGLRPGSYTVTETQPGGWLDGIDGTANTILTNPVDPTGSAGSATSNDTFTGIKLPTGSSSTVTAVDFGEIKPSSLAGTVWGESLTSENGTYDPGDGDVLIAGVTITLTGTDDRGNAVSRTLVTDASGNYDFTNVRPGTYAVTQTQPVDWADGDSHVGTGPATVGVRGGTNSTTGIVIVSDLTGTTGIDYDFHELERVDVAVVKNVYPTRPAGGVIGVNTSFTWRLTVTNNGPSRATNVTVQDDLAAIAEQHLTVTAVTPAAGTNCSAWTATATPANLTCVVASLARGASTTIDLSVRADAVPSPATTQLVNDVRITKLDQPDTNPANDQDADQVVVNPSDVWVTKTGSADQANVGDRITWTLQVGNKGPGTDPNVTLRDTLPARAVLVSVTPQRGTCGMNPAVANTVDCTLGAITMGETIDIVVVAVLPEAGTYRNHVVITPGGPDTDPTNHEGSHVVRVTVPGFNECTVEGDGVITGTPGDDVICGGGGRDIITCSGGNDTILGGGGNDVIDCSAQQCGAGVPTIIGGPGNDTIRIDCPGTALSPVVICGNEGNDRIIGGRGVDIIDGGAGNDFVNGRGGNDRLYGGTGNDRLYGGTGNDQLYGGSGNDRLYGQAGNDLLYGENGNDLVVGASGFDKAHGGNGNDVFQMRDRRRDLVIGGRGRDTLFRDRRIDRWRSVERVR